VVGCSAAGSHKLAMAARAAACGRSRDFSESTNAVTPAPHRRWFRFSLRTLFVVVTVFACWLGWNVNAVQKRKHLIDWAGFHGAKFNQDETWDRASPAVVARMEASKRERVAITRRMPQVDGIGWFRWKFLGDRAIECIWIPYVWRNEIETRQIDEAFPEAKIIVGANGWH
jgi:hypothetical protein